MLLTPADIAQITGDLVEVRQDNETLVAIRRGDTTLPPQPVRIARMGAAAQQKNTTGAQESRQRVLVLGSPTFNVAVGDRFNTSTELYQVTFIRPNRLAAVIAEAEAIE